MLGQYSRLAALKTRSRSSGKQRLARLQTASGQPSRAFIKPIQRLCKYPLLLSIGKPFGRHVSVTSFLAHSHRSEAAEEPRKQGAEQAAKVLEPALAG